MPHQDTKEKKNTDVDLLDIVEKIRQRLEIQGSDDPRFEQRL